MNNKQNKNSVKRFDHNMQKGGSKYKVVRTFPGLYKWYMEGNELNLNGRDAIVLQLVADGCLKPMKAVASANELKQKANKDGAPENKGAKSGKKTGQSAPVAGEDELNSEQDENASLESEGDHLEDELNALADETDLIPDEDEEEANDGK